MHVAVLGEIFELPPPIGNVTLAARWEWCTERFLLRFPRHQLRMIRWVIDCGTCRTVIPAGRIRHAFTSSALSSFLRAVSAFPNTCASSSENWNGFEFAVTSFNSATVVA